LSKPKPKPKTSQTTLHLNAGMSDRVLQFIEANYPKTVKFSEPTGNYGTLIIDGLSNSEIEDFMRQLSNIYPIERVDS